jgi:hypothetical protein
MANVLAVRERIEALCQARYGKFTTSDLYARLSRHHGGNPPVSRAALYSWFGSGGEPKQAMLECIPSFAAMFGVSERHLLQVAEVIPQDLGIEASVHDLRIAHRSIQKALGDAGFSSAGEALVIDRIMHHKLDYRIEVWPVVRGASRPVHLHSWILLQPLSPAESSMRLATVILEGQDPAQRRRYIRQTVITDGLWRALGLQWRDRLPPEYAYLEPEPLFIEVPVEERNRPVPDEPVFPHLRTTRVLVLGSAWSHAELMVALMADAVGFGSLDLRYLSLPPGHDVERRIRYCRARLAEARSRNAWAIAQRSDVLRSLRDDIVETAGPGQLVVLMSLGDRLREFAADALGTKLGYLDDTETVVDELGSALDGKCDIARVHVGDEDVLGPAGRSYPPADVRDRMVDVVRHLTAGVLEQLYWYRGGPGMTRWGDRFEDLRVGSEERPELHFLDSSVSWRHG